MLDPYNDPFLATDIDNAIDDRYHATRPQYDRHSGTTDGKPWEYWTLSAGGCLYGPVATYAAARELYNRWFEVIGRA